LKCCVEGTILKITLSRNPYFTQNPPLKEPMKRLHLLFVTVAVGVDNYGKKASIRKTSKKARAMMTLPPRRRFILHLCIFFLIQPDKGISSPPL
jgi:hypothetical protein